MNEINFELQKIIVLAYHLCLWMFVFLNMGDWDVCMWIYRKRSDKIIHALLRPLDPDYCFAGRITICSNSVIYGKAYTNIVI